MLELLKSQMDTGIGIGTAVIGIMGLAATSGFRIFALYEQHLSRRHHKTLKELHAAEASDSQLSQYLKNSLYVEGFRIASGISANRLTTDYLMRIAAVARWNRHQLKQIAKFVAITVDAREPVFRITRWQVASARFSIAFTIFLMLIGGVSGLGIMTKGTGSLADIFAGFAVEIMFVLAGLWVGTPYNSYKIARAFEDYVMQHPEVIAEKDSQTVNTTTDAAFDYDASKPRLPTVIVQ